MQTSLWKREFLFLILASTLAGCAIGHYTPLGEAEKGFIKPLKENVYRVEYWTSAYTSEDQLDRCLHRRCAELTLREGYDYFNLTQRGCCAGILEPHSHDGETVQRPVPAIADLYDPKEVLAESTCALRSNEQHTKDLAILFSLAPLIHFHLPSVTASPKTRSSILLFAPAAPCTTRHPLSGLCHSTA